MDHLRRSLLNHFTVQPLDRKAERRTDEQWIDTLKAHPETGVVPFWRNKFLVVDRGGVETMGTLPWAQASELAAGATPVFLGLDNERAKFALSLDSSSDAVGDRLAAVGEMKDLRTLGRVLSPAEASIAAHAQALCQWQDRHRFCPVCGSPANPIDAGHVLKCVSDSCARSHFPRMDSAIIVRVVHEDKLLLGRQAVWAENQYSVVAGFVEPGESLEQAVVREVMEETGVPVSEVHYQSSQPWPFPGNIMLGFSAVASGVEISLNDKELEHARWFTRQQIIDGLNERTLRVPPFISISFRLIEHWFNEGSDVTLKQVTDAAGYEWTPPPLAS